MITHQLKNTIGAEIYNAFIYKNINYAQHFHKGIEFVFVLNGTLNSNVNGVEYTLNSGESLLLFPFNVHSYKTTSNCEVLIVVFSDDYVQSFMRLKNNYVAINNKFTLTNSIKNYVLENLAIKNNAVLPFYDNHADSITELITPDYLTIKSVAYCICNEFNKQVKFTKKGRLQNDVLVDCLIYVENNYMRDVSLNDMCKHLGYDYNYLSRIFNNQMKTSFKTILNQRRLEHAVSLLSKSGVSISVACFESGFQSVRTFNRVFKEFTNKNPSQFFKNKT